MNRCEELEKVMPIYRKGLTGMITELSEKEPKSKFKSTAHVIRSRREK